MSKVILIYDYFNLTWQLCCSNINEEGPIYILQGCKQKRCFQASHMTLKSMLWNSEAWVLQASRPKLRYKGTLKSNLRWCGIKPCELETAAMNRPAWRSTVSRTTSAFEEDHKTCQAAAREVSQGFDTFPLHLWHLRAIVCLQPWPTESPTHSQILQISSSSG